MAARFTITVILRSDRKVAFEDIEPRRAFAAEKEGVKLTVGAECPAPVTATPPAGELVKSVEYNLFTDMRNYHKVIIPESGRWFINMTQLVSFWRHKSDSAVNDVKMPLYIFTGQDLNMGMAFGVIGPCYETAFKTLEPTVNRALIAFMRRLSMQIKRGTDLYPIPDRIARQNADGSITEYLYFRTDRDVPKQPWLLTLRNFAAHQKRIYNLPDVTSDGALEPLWCSWTDWFSDDVTHEVMVRSAHEGVKLGIKNYIIDDGWFGPGLDNDYSVELNIGDWRPDPAKIKDMPKLVGDIRREGGVPMIWCAPHAVAAGAQCFPQRRKYLIVDDKGELLMTPNKFHSLCFMNPQARQIMADICTGFIREWDFDGAKYDLFNCIPNARCCSKEHGHDATSMVEGLEWTLKLIDDSCRALKKNYIVELKQNYATPFLSRYGTMTRAGDTPYNTEGNFLRTLYVQGYSPFSINDYQTITNEDSPEAAACVVLKMMAVGIPTYSIDFDRLRQPNKDVIAHYNAWYRANLPAFRNYRVPLDGENNVFKIAAAEGLAKKGSEAFCRNGPQGASHKRLLTPFSQPFSQPQPERDLFFMVNDGGSFDVGRPATILNGTFKTDLFVRGAAAGKATITVLDCLGRQVSRQRVAFKGWKHLEMTPGGIVQIDC